MTDLEVETVCGVPVSGSLKRDKDRLTFNCRIDLRDVPVHRVGLNEFFVEVRLQNGHVLTMQVVRSERDPTTLDDHWLRLEAPLPEERFGAPTLEQEIGL